MSNTIIHFLGDGLSADDNPKFTLQVSGGYGWYYKQSTQELFEREYYPGLTNDGKNWVQLFIEEYAPVSSGFIVKNFASHGAMFGNRTYIEEYFEKDMDDVVAKANAYVGTEMFSEAKLIDASEMVSVENQFSQLPVHKDEDNTTLFVNVGASDYFASSFSIFGSEWGQAPHRQFTSEELEVAETVWTTKAEKSIGILKSKLNECIESKNYDRIYIHRCVAIENIPLIKEVIDHQTDEALKTKTINYVKAMDAGFTAISKELNEKYGQKVFVIDMPSSEQVAEKLIPSYFQHHGVKHNGEAFDAKNFSEDDRKEVSGFAFFDKKYPSEKLSCMILERTVKSICKQDKTWAKSLGLAGK